MDSQLRVKQLQIHESMAVPVWRLNLPLPRKIARIRREVNHRQETGRDHGTGSEAEVGIDMVVATDIDQGHHFTEEDKETERRRERRRKRKRRPSGSGSSFFSQGRWRRARRRGQ